MKAMLRKHRTKSLAGLTYVLTAIVDLLLKLIDSLCDRDGRSSLFFEDRPLTDSFHLYSGFLLHGTAVIRLEHFVGHVAIKKWCLR